MEDIALGKSKLYSAQASISFKGKESAESEPKHFSVCRMKT